MYSLLFWPPCIDEQELEMARDGDGDKITGCFQFFHTNKKFLSMLYRPVERALSIPASSASAERWGDRPYYRTTSGKDVGQNAVVTDLKMQLIINHYTNATCILGRYILTFLRLHFIVLIDKTHLAY